MDQPAATKIANQNMNMNHESSLDDGMEKFALGQYLSLTTIICMEIECLYKNRDHRSTHDERICLERKTFAQR